MLDDGDARADTRWFSHAEGAHELGIKVKSFRRLAARQCWGRMCGNDGGDRVAVPVEVIDRYKSRGRSAQAAASRLGREGAITVADTIAGLLANCRLAEARARGLEAEMSQQRERAMKAEAAAVELRRMLILAEGALRGAADARGEAEAAATKARDEAARACADAERLKRDLDAMVAEGGGLRETLSAEQAERERLRLDFDGAGAVALEVETALRAAREAAEKAELARREAEARASAGAARALEEVMRAAEAVQRAEEAERRAAIAETRQQALRAEAERRVEERRQQAAAEAAAKAQASPPRWLRVFRR
jgi:hypothetical protein